MNFKLIFLCLLCGLLTAVLLLTFFCLMPELGLFFIFVLPGIIFGLVLTKYFKRSNPLFIIASAVIYFICALFNTMFMAKTYELIIIACSLGGMLSLLGVFNNRVVPLANFRKAALIGSIGSVVSALVIVALVYYIDHSSEFNGEGADVLMIMSNFLIFPLWQTAFAMAIKTQPNNEINQV